MLAIDICTQFEKILRPLGWHVALTGSSLYGEAGGGGTGKDIDIIVYPHLTDKGQRVSEMSQEEILNALNLNDYYKPIFSEDELTEEYNVAISSYVWIGKRDNCRIDIFFMEGDKTPTEGPLFFDAESLNSFDDNSN